MTGHEVQSLRLAPSMHFPDPVAFRQLTVIRKIIADETWLESERRGYRVAENDPVVVENVCQVVLRIGAELRERLSADLGKAPGRLPAGSPAESLTRREDQAA